MRAEAAHLALGMRACGHEVIALGECGAWRLPLRDAGVTLSEPAPAAHIRKITALFRELDAQVVHAFGIGAAHRLLPAAAQVGAGSVATLSHQDVPSVSAAEFRHVSAIFVPCEHLREQLLRHLPATLPIHTTGYALPPFAAIPEMRRQALAEELGLDARAPLVLLADHFHGGETEIARLLIEAAPLLAEYQPEMQMLIVGAGARLGELATRAAEINSLLRRRMIILPGARPDLAPLLALTTVAVGSGRFAAEAQAAGVALVAAGAAGLCGTVTEESANIARYTCSGRHGRLEPATVRALASEILGLISYPEYRRHFADEQQAALLATAERQVLAERIARSYRRAAPSGAFERAPRRLTAILPDDLRELLFTLPALSALRAGYPQASLRLITTPLHRGLLEQMGLASQVLLKPMRLSAWPAFLHAQWRKRADICLDFTEEAHSALLALSSLAAHRWGFIASDGNLFLSDHLPAHLPASHARALLLTQSLDISTGARVPPPVLLPETREVVQLSLLSAGVEYQHPLLLLCPQVEEARAWPLAHWVALAAALLAARPERIAVLGAPEAPWPVGVVQVMPVQDSLVLATLLARATLVVAPDTAALHLAAILGIPAVGLYGPAAPEEDAFHTAHCRALHGPQGVADILPETVVAAIEELLPTPAPPIPLP